MNCFRMIMYTMTTYFIPIHGQVMLPSCIFHLAVSSTTVVQSTTTFITSIATSSVVLSTSNTVITTSITSLVLLVINFRLKLV